MLTPEHAAQLVAHAVYITGLIVCVLVVPSLLGGLLSGVGSWLSFGLLMLSSTPAIANFGLAISLGLVFSFLLAPWASPPVSHEKDLRHG